MKNQEKRLKIFVRGNDGSEIILPSREGQKEKIPAFTRNQLWPRDKYKIILDPNLVDIVEFNQLIYKIFWNRHFFATQRLVTTCRWPLTLRSWMAMTLDSLGTALTYKR